MPAIKTKGGNVNEGPQRWVRARENAEKRPTSAGGKLYRKRAGIAAELKQFFFAYQDQGFTVLRSLDRNNRRTRSIHVCSVVCLGFQMQLETSDALGIEQYSALIDNAIARRSTATATFTWKPTPEHTYDRSLTIQTLEKSSLARPIACRVCGTSMVGDKQTVKAIEAKTEAVKQYVLANGVFVALEHLTVVDLTDHDRALLSQYSTPELRAAYVQQHGHRFDG